MSDISPSALKLTPTQEEHVKTLTNTSDITEYLKNLSVENGLLRRDWDPALFIEVPAGTAARAPGFAKTIVVNGVKTIIEGATETELLANENKFYRAQLTPAATTEQQARDAETGRFVAEPTPADRQADEAADRAAAAVEAQRIAGLQMQMQVNQITLSEFLEQSGAIEKHLERRETEFQHSGWVAATEDFLQSAEGANWPGGEALNRLGQIIKANGLEDAADKLDVLKQAWAIMQQEDYETAVGGAVTNAKSSGDLRAAIALDGSSLFGR